MSLANEMNTLSKIAVDLDTELNDIYIKFISKIRDKAMKGEKEISWYDNPIYYKFKNPNRNKLLNMLKSKLEREGFRYVYGYQIGKPMGNSQSEYIIW